MLLFVFFFCKQKTAYEMRISDWSSDVCSSDLLAHLARCHRLAGAGPDDLDDDILVEDHALHGHRLIGDQAELRRAVGLQHRDALRLQFGAQRGRQGLAADQAGFQRRRAATKLGALLQRSEEHTSELQSLMRTSYAVF